jgi:hypothetical protein
MPKLTYNLEDMSEPAGVPPGRYLVKVEKVKQAIAHNSNEMLVWKWEIVDGDHAGEVIYDSTTLQKDYLCYFKRRMVALGYSGAINVDTKDLKGKLACLIVGTREIKDKDTDEITTVPCVLDVLPASQYKQSSDSE